MKPPGSVRVLAVFICLLKEAEEGEPVASKGESAVMEIGCGLETGLVKCSKCCGRYRYPKDRSC